MSKLRTIDYSTRFITQGPRDLAQLADYHGPTNRMGFGDGKLSSDELDAFIRDAKITPHPGGMNLVNFDENVVKIAAQRAGQSTTQGAEYGLSRAIQLRQVMSSNRVVLALKKTSEGVANILLFPIRFVQLFGGIVRFLSGNSR